jgi:aquaporin related protein
VTIALWLVGAVPVVRASLLIPTQLAGGILASIIVSELFSGPLKVQTSLGAGTSPNQGLFIEMFLAMELIFTILMLAVEKHRATPMAPIGIGAALAVGHIIGKFKVLI